MSDALSVYLSNERVGRLWLNQRRDFLFEYDAAWLTSGNAVQLSMTLPLQKEPFDNDMARPFFSNLLPESELRSIIARGLGLSEGNDFALLEAIGGECAGAVSLLPEGQERSESGEYQPLSDDELNRLVNELPKRPMLAGRRGIRLSLAGVQNKLPVYYDDVKGVVNLPTGNIPSSHILKPPIQHFSQTVANELFCMRLANRMGLPVPEVILLQKESPLYLINRYDRKMIAEGGITRLHQEDFCQALGIAPDMKYEKEGGPSQKACFELLRNHSITPIIDVRALLNWTIFNFLIGNADAHGKNISLLFMDDGPVLAPFYDLLSTAVYPELAERIAMKIGGEDRPDWIISRRWEQFATDIGINFKLVRQNLLAMSEKIIVESETLKREHVLQYGDCDIIDQIIVVIEQRSRKVLSCL